MPFASGQCFAGDGKSRGGKRHGIEFPLPQSQRQNLVARAQLQQRKTQGQRQARQSRGNRRRREIGEHTSELQSHSFISYAVFCLKKKKKINKHYSYSSASHRRH